MTSKLYLLKNQSFDTFDVIFENTHEVQIENPHTEIIDNTVCHKLGVYKKIDNEPNILKMIIRSIPTIDITIHFDDSNKCIKIIAKTNKYIQKENKPFMINRDTIEMVDTTKYSHFSIDNI